MNQRQLYDYYSNQTVLEQIFSSAKTREISAALRDGGHMSRPNSVEYQRDILELVKKGAVSFHGTVEHWKNPLMIKTGMRPEELNELRTGWDLIIDIDSSIGLDAAKLATRHVLDFLRSYGVKASIKFSGNRGFHVGVPWNALPQQVDFEAATAQFPKLPRIVSSFIKESIKERLFVDLKKMKGSIHELLAELGETNVSALTPYMFVDIENNWGERHLFRLPYSINEKSWLVSLPLSADELEKFKPEHASPSRVINYKAQKFLEADGRADELLVTAVDWHSSRIKAEKVKPQSVRKRTATKEIPETAFPPCIKLIMNGLSDGRKRSILVLVNFLQQMNWPWEKIETAVREANKKNRPPLPDSYVTGQLNWFRRGAEMGRQLLPPNCVNEAFYASFGICQPDERCKNGMQTIQIKNPVSYPFTRGLKTSIKSRSATSSV